MSPYYLYEGSSEDGRGTSHYVGQTLDKTVAQAHLDSIRKNPYWFGHVLTFTDKEEIHTSSWDKLL